MIFIFSSLRRWDEFALIFQNSGWCTEELKADWHVLLAIIFERSAFLRQWLLCALLLFPLLPPQKTSENRVSRTRKWSKLFQFPTPLLWCHISHPSINSQPSCVGVSDSMNTLYLLAEDTEIVPTSVKVFTVVVIVLIRYNVVWTSRWRNIYFVFSGQGSMEKLV